MLAGFCAAHHQPAAEKFLHGAFRFLYGLHLHKSKTLRALVVSVTYDLRILHVPDTVEQLKEIALSGVEGQVADVKTRRSYFDPFRFSRRSRRLCAVARRRCYFRCTFAVSEKKCGYPLPECLLLSFGLAALRARAAVAPASGTAARMARASPR